MRNLAVRQQGSVAVVIILLLGCAVAAAIYWLRPKPEIRPLTEPKPPVVSVIGAITQRHQVKVKTQGTVTPSRAIDLVAEVSGRVTRVHEQFANGAFFNQGDILVGLDDRDYQYRLVEMEAQVAAAQRELAIERGQARQAKRQWRDLGTAEANALFLRQPQVKAAEAQLASAIAQQNQAKLNLQRTSIQSPFSGRIQETRVNLGQYVTAGTVVARVYDSQRAEVRLPLTDKQIAKVGLPLGSTLQPEQQAKVMLSASLAGQVQQWPATIVRTEASVDTNTRFYFAVAEIPEPYDQSRYAAPLVNGLFVEADIEGLYFEDVIQVPEKSVFKNQYVFVVGADNQLEQRNIEVISRENGALWIRGDVITDELVVVSDPNVLHEKLVVTVKQI